MITVILLDPPTVGLNEQGCVGDTFILTAESDNDLFWFNDNNDIVSTENQYITPELFSSTTYFVEQSKTVSEVQCVK
ncbi:MAG: hypothetical protein R2728_07790 [Chitinophagales bacterium]